MNLARVLFKKHHQHPHPHPQQQQQSERAVPADDQAAPEAPVTAHDGEASRLSPTVSVEEDSDAEARTRSPTKRSPRRRPRSGRSKERVDGANSTHDGLAAKPLRTTVFKAIKMSSHKHFAQVLPNLLLGSQEMAHDQRALNHSGVTHILNVTAEVDDRFPGHFVYKRIAISDMPSTPIVDHFADAFRFIDDGRASPGGVRESSRDLRESSTVPSELG